MAKDAADPTDFEEKNNLATGLAVPTGEVTPDPNRAPPAADAPEVGMLAGIPDSVRKNLVGLDKLELEEFILKVLAIPGAIYTVNRIVLVLAHKYQRADDRALIMTRLRGLIGQGLVHKEPRARGIYSITDAGKRVLGL